ncbi:hypothetical protein RFI_32325 [Reticulomyxa filosa]|uniref:Uncharacterized protein n=1 Tax=Reticulomyxa filosa TaxID=46433 RepID=X6LTV2_RETFI|nr:hypothetical protein RFI_32325 [Reticulomyxa filosa]|eukprot:ETO05069.1 hypothetical protein RFI_32325 [Reticulomyxa filosa]
MHVNNKKNNYFPLKRKEIKGEMEMQLMQELADAKLMISNLVETSRTQNSTILKLNRENNRFSVENQTQIKTIESLRDENKKLFEEITILQEANHSYMSELMTLRGQLDNVNAQSVGSPAPYLNGLFFF